MIYRRILFDLLYPSLYRDTPDLFSSLYMADLVLVLLVLVLLPIYFFRYGCTYQSLFY